MKPTVLELRRKKGARLAMLTAYDFPTARLVAEAGVDLILVGDSLGMVVLGYDSTLPVTVDDMVHHTRAARARRARRPSSSPTCPSFPTARRSEALATAARLMKEAGADSVKLEGGEEVAPLVEALVRAGVPVLGHVGLTPQTASALGGYKLQGKDEDGRAAHHGRRASARAGRLLGRGARARSGAAREAHHREASSIPTIGIGAGADCDGQVLVFHDMVGMFSGFTPTFVKRYTEAGTAIRDAVAQYAEEVRNGTFPSTSQAFPMKDEVLKKIYGG